MSRKLEIREYVRCLAREFNPQRVILFGSCARGDAHEDSDVDLLVVMDQIKDTDEEAIRMRRTIPRTFPLDLIVKRSSEVNRRAAPNGSFIRTLMEEGRVLYERRG
ncbi:MAG: nucleotidyltransferase domain-containing protein [bacterium]